MSDKIQLLIGADPEVFMAKDGKYISAHNAIPGDKKNPHKVDKGAVQVDGLALEFNIDPASSPEEFAANIKAVMATLAGMVPGYELAAVPVAEFGFDYLKQQPKEALELGCDPDFDAWSNGAANPRPNGEVDFRTGAGHVHIGWGSGFNVQDPQHIADCVMLSKQLDFFLGIPSIQFDEGQKRRELYGNLGAFRPKPYGMEYRVLSNAWLKDERLMQWVFNNTTKAFQALVDGKYKPQRYVNPLKHITTIFKTPKGQIRDQRLAAFARVNQIDLPPVLEG